MPALLRNRENRSRGWLLRPPASDVGARVFCFPYSGLGASMYSAWPRRIGNVELCLLQPPAREGRIREEHYGDYDSLAASLVPFLAPWLDKPYGFFGHCGGALPGFATTVRIQAEGLPMPTRLFVSSQVAPHDGPYGRFLGLDDAELIRELETLTVAMGGRPDPDMIELGLTVLRADLEANRAYRLDGPVLLDTGITAIGWHDDAEVRPELMTGWRHYTEDIRTVVLDGSHHTFRDAPDALMAELRNGVAVRG